MIDHCEASVIYIFKEDKTKKDLFVSGSVFDGVNLTVPIQSLHLYQFNRYLVAQAEDPVKENYPVSDINNHIPNVVNATDNMPIGSDAVGWAYSMFEGFRGEVPYASWTYGY